MSFSFYLIVPSILYKSYIVSLILNYSLDISETLGYFIANIYFSQNAFDSEQNADSTKESISNFKSILQFISDY